MEIKPDQKISAVVTIAVAIIGCLGVLGAALINTLPEILRPTPTSIPTFLGEVIPSSTAQSQQVAFENTPVIISSATVEVIIPTSVPVSFTPAPPLTKHEFVSLQNIGIYDSGNLGLQAGVQTLANTNFEVGWLVTTRSQDTPNSTDNIVLDVRQTSNQVSKVHFLWQAGWCFLSNNTKIGTISIIFSDGRKIDEPIIVGNNIRDWSKINNPLTSQYTQEAWNGIAPDGKTRGIIDVFTINLSSEYASTQIVQIEIKDESMEILNSLNPAFHLWAVTMER